MFKALAQWFQGLLKSKAIQQFEDFCKEVFIAEKTLIWSQLKDIAIAAVEALATSTLSGSSKKGIAMATVAENAKNAGITALESDISLVIELAVTRMKNNAGNNGTVNG